MNCVVAVVFSTIVLINASPQYFYINQPAFYHFPTTHSFGNSFTTFHANPQFHYRTLPVQAALPAPVPQNNAEYRGFAYHTKMDNGATSHVLFVTGPQSQQINPKMFSHHQQNTVANPARTVASEMIDSVQKSQLMENVLPNNIQDLYSPPMQIDNNDPYQIFQMFEANANPATRLVNFYSRNSQLFAAQVPGYPANVAPLHAAITPRFLNTDDNKYTEKNNTEIAAESIITNTRFGLNGLDKNQGPDESDSKSLSLLYSAETATTNELLLSTPSVSLTPKMVNFNSSTSSNNLLTSSTASPSEANTPVNNVNESSPILTTSTSSLESSSKADSGDLTEDFLSQRFGTQPEQRAESSVSSYEMPLSSSVEASISEVDFVTSSMPESYGQVIKSSDGLTKYNVPIHQVKMDEKDLILIATTGFLTPEASTVTAQSSKSGNNMLNIQGVSTSTANNTKSSEKSAMLSTLSKISKSSASITENFGNSTTSNLNDFDTTTLLNDNDKYTTEIDVVQTDETTFETTELSTSSNAAKMDNYFVTMEGNLNEENTTTNNLPTQSY